MELSNTALCGVWFCSCASPRIECNAPCRPIKNRRRAAAVMQARKHEKKASVAPTSVNVPIIRGKPALSANTCNGATLLSRVVASPWKPRTSVYAHRKKKSPVRIALHFTARGMLVSGSRASEPSDVALSKPTELNIASTKPSRSCCGVTPSERKLPHVDMRSILDQNAHRNGADQCDRSRL